LAIESFGFLRILKVSNLVGKKLTFEKFRDDNRLSDIFPLSGIVKKRITLGEEKDWLLVELESSFDSEGNEIENVLIKSKDEGIIVLKEKDQLVYFRLVSHTRDIKDSINETSKFPFINWVLCE